MSRLPAASLNVVVVDILLGSSRSRYGHRLGDLNDAFFAGSSHCGVVAVREVGVDAGRVQFCSHLLLQGQSHNFIAYWQLAGLLPTLFGPFQGFWK